MPTSVSPLRSISVMQWMRIAGTLGMELGQNEDRPASWNGIWNYEIQLIVVEPSATNLHLLRSWNRWYTWQRDLGLTLRMAERAAVFRERRREREM